MRQSICTLVVSLAFALALSSCSVPPRPGQQADGVGGGFSTTDKKVAATLSIGNEMDRGTTSPQFEAALCGLALREIDDRLQGNELLTADQRRAFARAQDVYKRRATSGQTPEQIEKIQRDVDAAYPDGESRARFAVICLRQLTATN